MNYTVKKMTHHGTEIWIENGATKKRNFEIEVTLPFMEDDKDLKEVIQGHLMGFIEPHRFERFSWEGKVLEFRNVTARRGVIADERDFMHYEQELDSLFRNEIKLYLDKEIKEEDFNEAYQYFMELEKPEPDPEEIARRRAWKEKVLNNEMPKEFYRDIAKILGPMRKGSRKAGRNRLEQEIAKGNLAIIDGRIRVIRD